MMQQCYYYDKCKNHTFLHCSRFLHPIRKKKCKYFPCKLLHDPTHLLNFIHEKQYDIIANNNLLYNKNHIFNIIEIWYVIHTHIRKMPIHINIINNLLATSKIFNILLNIQFRHVNIVMYSGNKIIYRNYYGINKCRICNYLNHSCVCNKIKKTCEKCYQPYYDSDDSYDDYDY